MIQNQFCILSLIGLLPALIIMYYILGTYDKYFKHNMAFMFFAGGIVLGAIVFFFHLMLDTVFLSAVDIALLGYVVGFSLLEEVSKYAILYWSKFRGDYETTYYGLSLGLAQGALIITGLVYLDTALNPVSFLNYLVLPTMIMMSIGIVSLNGGTGALIGYGSSIKVRWKYLIRALLIHMIFNCLLVLLWWSDFPMRTVISVFLMVIGLGLIFYIKEETIPDTLPPELQRKHRRERRKTIRGDTKGGKRRERAPIEDAEE